MEEKLYLREEWLKQAEELYKDPKKEEYYFAGNVHKKNLDGALDILDNQDTREDFYAYDIGTGEAKVVGRQNKLKIMEIPGSIDNSGKTNPDYHALFVKIID